MIIGTAIFVVKAEIELVQAPQKLSVSLAAIASKLPTPRSTQHSTQVFMVPSQRTGSVLMRLARARQLPCSGTVYCC